MEKINIADLLRDCPSGMELDCSVFEDVTLYRIDTDTENEYPIRIITKNDNFLDLTKYGTYSNVEEAKCVIFPKGKTTWKDFHRPFKDGDILFYKHKTNNIKYTFIYKRRIDMHHLLHYCGWFSEKPFFSEQFNAKERMPLYENDDIRFATEEEKTQLFDAIKANGYRWNNETKTLENLIGPIFKINDNIQSKDIKSPVRIVDIKDGKYIFENGDKLDINLQNRWEFVSNKFDINRLIPFESKVLVRDYPNEKWRPAIWGFYDNDDKDYSQYIIESGINYNYCIPYKGNEHLIGTINECEKYYKTWEDEN